MNPNWWATIILLSFTCGLIAAAEYFIYREKTTASKQLVKNGRFRFYYGSYLRNFYRPYPPRGLSFTAPPLRTNKRSCRGFFITLSFYIAHGKCVPASGKIIQARRNSKLPAPRAACLPETFAGPAIYSWTPIPVFSQNLRPTAIPYNP